MSSNCDTPKKIYPRKDISVCRLCGKEEKTCHLIRIFSKNGEEKKLQELIATFCSIQVYSHDYMSKTICRACQKFIFKIQDFRKNCQENQATLKQNFSFKRTILSPSNSEVIPSISSINTSNPKKKLKFTGTKIENEENQVVININQNKIEKTRYVSFVTKNPVKPKVNVTLDISNKNSSMLNMDTTLLQKKVEFQILESLNSSCESLCKRKDKKSVLLDTSYNGLTDEFIDKLWKEIKDNHPFLIEVFNSVACKNNKTDIVLNENKTKYCLIYAILMNCRWHELSLFQRIVTILLIEGGCSKEVTFKLFQSVSNYIRYI